MLGDKLMQLLFNGKFQEFSTLKSILILKINTNWNKTLYNSLTNRTKNTGVMKVSTLAIRNAKHQYEYMQMSELMMAYRLTILYNV